MFRAVRLKWLYFLLARTRNYNPNDPKSLSRRESIAYKIEVIEDEIWRESEE